MTFTNEFISSEDFKNYDIEGVMKQIQGPVFIYAPPYGWTIDRDRNIFLLYLETGRDERSNRLTFALCWDGALIVTELEMQEGSYSDRFNGKAIWGLCKLECPDSFSVERDEVIRVLKQAMICRGSRGAFGQIKNYSVEFNF